MARLIHSLKTFPFKSMLVILSVFMMIAVVLFAERSGIHYTEKTDRLIIWIRMRLLQKKQL